MGVAKNRPCMLVGGSPTCPLQDGGGNASWRAAVLTNLDAWWGASQCAAEVLLANETTPDAWHRAFVEEIVLRLPDPGGGSEAALHLMEPGAWGEIALRLLELRGGSEIALRLLGGRRQRRRRRACRFRRRRCSG